MTAVAIRRWIARVVVAADVAVHAGVDHGTNRPGHRRAWRDHVRTLQREARGAVVKLTVGPEKRVVAGRTHRGGEARRNVIRHISTERRSAIPRRLVTAVTICVCGGEVVVVVDVAVRALVDLARRRQLV